MECTIADYISHYDLDIGNVSFFLENLPEESLSVKNDKYVEFKNMGELIIIAATFHKTTLTALNSNTDNIVSQL